ncbi:MAG: hypothetical protein ATN31_09390 [Candidatus Epulonipiscioides saccharophilum]|nr:MAG: hypothetical protein ATN31_09390 [Epulopiscium sp. AS2M-Bin001]
MISHGEINIGLKRNVNQDRIFISDVQIGALPNLYIVADGMGGLDHGALASQIAIDEFVKYIQDFHEVDLSTHDSIINLLNRSLSHANYILFNTSKKLDSNKGMGTTFTAATIINGYIYVTYVGDSRVYALNKKDLIQLTTDHSVVQEMYESGALTLNETLNHPMSYMITRAVGIQEAIKSDSFAYDLNYTDLILLCSDGVYGMLSDSLLCDIITKTIDIKNSLPTLSKQIIDQANNNGGLDNIALILISTEVD